MAEETKKPHGFHIDPSDLVLEIASIVIAIAIATAVGKWRQAQQERGSVRHALGEIRSEIAANRATLVGLMPLHRSIHTGFGKLITSHERTESLTYDQFGDTFSAVAPRGMQPFHALDTAWQVARDTGTSAHFDYPLLTKLERTYASQDFLNGYRDRLLNDLHADASTERPNFYFVAANFEIDFSDLTSAETTLIDDYTQALSAIDATAPR